MGYHNDYYDNNYNNDYHCVVKKVGIKETDLELLSTEAMKVRLSSRKGPYSIDILLCMLFILLARLFQIL